MANTKKTTTTKTTTKNNKKTTPVEIKEQELIDEVVNETLIDEVVNETKEQELMDENEMLRKQMEEMQAQMATLMKAVGNDNQNVEKKSVSSNRQITFVNLSNGTLVLKGTRVWKIEGQFATRNFTEREAQIILNNTPKVFNEGYCYIADAEFVEDNDLAEVYNNILTDEQLKTILSREPRFVIEAYKSASDAQKNIIIGMITDKRLAGVDVDGNILIELGKLSKVDLVGIEPESPEDNK